MNIIKSFNVLFLHKFIQRYASSSSTLATDLKDIVGNDNVSNTAPVREQHGLDGSYHTGHKPDVVVFAQSTDYVSQIVKYCASKRIPVIPFGTGTGLEVQAGVTRIALNGYIRDTGLQFPIDPGADPSLGGMCTTSASGTMAVHYRTMRENFMNLEVVLADGSVIKTSGLKGRSRKTSAGYNSLTSFL